MSNITDRRETVADKLREARALIERGWIRGTFQRGRCYCAIGAMRKAALPDYHLLNQMLRTLRRAEPEARFIATWNDAQPSKEPVLAAFDKAITLADSSQ